MFIIPFTHSTVHEPNFDVITINLFTVGGKKLWEESDNLNIDKDILNPNTLYRKGTIIKSLKDVYICEIDKTKTNINEFYNWNEIDINDTDTFCWRKMVVLLDKNETNWLDVPDDEKLSKFSIKTILKTIIQKKLKRTSKSSKP
jgi:hypothetical protein